VILPRFDQDIPEPRMGALGECVGMPLGIGGWNSGGAIDRNRSGAGSIHDVASQASRFDRFDCFYPRGLLAFLPRVARSVNY